MLVLDALFGIKTYFKHYDSFYQNKLKDKSIQKLFKVLMPYNSAT